MDNNNTQNELNEGNTKRLVVVVFWVVVIVLVIVALAYVVWQKQMGTDVENEDQGGSGMTSEERLEALNQLREGFGSQSEEPSQTSEERLEALNQIKGVLEEDNEEPSQTSEERAAALDELRNALNQ